MSDLTRLLDAAGAGDPHAAADLLPLVYDELRRLAAAPMAAEKPGQTLQATALVNEAYLRLVGPAGGGAWNSRGHFFGAAAEAMRRILVEAARRKRRIKHGGARRRVELDDVTADLDGRSDDLLALDEALESLAREDPTKAELVKLRYFAGLTLEEAAACQGVSLATAKRRWALARAWLYDAISTIPKNPSAVAFREIALSPNRYLLAEGAPVPNAIPSLDTIFCEAIELPDAETRAAYMASACGPDDTLRRRVEALVEAHFRAGGSFLEQPPPPSIPSPRSCPRRTSAPARTSAPRSGRTRCASRSARAAWGSCTSRSKRARCGGRWR